MVPIGNQRGKRMWPSLPTAGHIADVANWFFIGSLVVGVVSTTLIVWMAGVKEAYWERDRTESAERIAELIVQGDQLRKGTAEANARAAEASKQAVEAQLALEKFKSPRRLTMDQIDSLIGVMKRFAGTQFDVAMAITDPEAEDLLGQIEDTMAAAGLVQIPWSGTEPGSLLARRSGRPAVGGTSVPGVKIGPNQQHLAELIAPSSTLATQLRGMGIDALAVFGPTTENNNPNAMHILVGKKDR
jgi:hypothetical protein